MNVSLRNIAALAIAAMACGLSACRPTDNNTLPMKTEHAASEDSNTNAAAAKTDDEWRRLLTPEQYRVLRKAGTEPSFGPAYEEFKNQGAGTYVCAGCGAELFSSKEKFDSHCGWPSFYDPANARNVKTRDDYTLGTVRTEVTCARCGGHLGHVFKGEGFKTPTDTRYCINGVSLKFVPNESPKDVKSR